LPSQDPAAYENMMLELQALDAKMRVIAQRLKIIEKNEQIIGKTLITHSKKIKEFRVGAPSPSNGPSTSATAEDFRKTSVSLSSSLEKMKADVQKNKETIDKIKSDVSEMKYVLDTINPVSYVTVSQVEDLVDEKLKKGKD
jgi:hypothetical protein